MSNAVLVRDDFDTGTAPWRAQRLAADALAAAADRYPHVTVECAALESTSDRLAISKWSEATQTTELPLIIFPVGHGRSVTHISTLSGSGGSGTFVAHGGSGTLQLGSSNAYWTTSNFWQCEPLVFVDACMQRVVWDPGDVLDVTALVSVNPDLAATVDKINASLEGGRVDEDSLDAARLAVGQAIEFIHRNDLPGRPRVMMSDDGVLTLQWRGDELGAALVFTGDGTVSVAFKNAEKSYSETREDVALDAPAPPTFVSLVETIVG